MRKLKPLVWLGVIILVLSMFIVVACTTQPAQSGSSGGDSNSTSKQEVVKPTPNANGVITADQWKDIYPDVYSSYQMSKSNSTNTPSYLEQYPFLVTMYDGSGFAKDYKEARGHLYTLQDVAETARPHAAANCLTCKTPEMTAMVNSQGASIYSTPFEDIYSKINEPIGCYNCHENTGDTLVVTAGYLNTALGSDKSKVGEGTLVCGQCHNEYYFDPETKAATLPWSGLSNMTADQMLAYYNEKGFKDFTNGISGADMIKVQHPEFETVLGANNKMQSMGGFTCSTCHMGTLTNSDGEEYYSHYWQSPLKNTGLIQNAQCNSCHDLAANVVTIQKTTRARLVTLGEKIADLHKKIGAAAADGSKSAEQLAELRSLVRNGQFYYDFVFVENSDGAHNSALTKELLDKSEKIVDQALAML